MRRLLSILAFFALGTATAADTARSHMEAFSKDLKSVTADFSQTVTDANGGRGDASRGTMALEAPRQFRWETKQPYEQTIVADGTRVWIYEPDLQQVSVRSQSGEEAHSPLTVLTDLSQLDSQFTTSESGERDGLVWLKLASKAKEPEFEYAELGFSGTSLERMLFRDQLGNTTEIAFSNWRRNPKIDAGEFKFTPPKGVDVIGNMDPGAEIHPVRD
jgi:outer membrane lipoprotein carrier protein